MSLTVSALWLPNAKPATQPAVAQPDPATAPAVERQEREPVFGQDLWTGPSLASTLASANYTCDGPATQNSGLRLR